MRKQRNSELEGIRESDVHDDVTIEESDDNAFSSLASARSMVTRLRNQPLSRIISYFNAVVEVGRQNKATLIKMKDEEDRLRYNDNKLQKIVDERFQLWVTKMAKAPQTCKEAIKLGSNSSDYRMGLDSTYGQLRWLMPHYCHRRA